MLGVRNTTARDIVLTPGGVVPAGRIAKVSGDDLAQALQSPDTMGAINSGRLAIHHGKTASDDLQALRELAAGDGRRRDVKEARVKLAKIEGR